MLKSSGSSCLISDPRFENLEVCWGGRPGRSAACSPRASSVGRLAANISLQSCYANRALLVEGARRGRSATLGATSGKDDAHSSRRHTRGAPGGLTRALKQACSCASRSAICVQHFDDSLSSAIRTTYRISLRSSSLREPRHPLLKVVSWFKSVGDAPRQKEAGGRAPRVLCGVVVKSVL